MRIGTIIVIALAIVVAAYLVTKTEYLGGRGGGGRGGRGGGGRGGRGRGWGRGFGRGYGYGGGYGPLYRGWGWGYDYPWLYDDYYYYPYVIDLPSTPSQKCLDLYKAAIDAGKSKEEAFSILKACL